MNTKIRNLVHTLLNYNAGENLENLKIRLNYIAQELDSIPELDGLDPVKLYQKCLNHENKPNKRYEVDEQRIRSAYSFHSAIEMAIDGEDMGPVSWKAFLGFCEGLKLIQALQKEDPIK